MLTDLNVPWPAVPNKISLANLSKTLDILRDLGYTAVALNYTIDGTSKNPLATTAGGSANVKHNVTDAVCQIDLSLLPAPIPAGLRVLRRVTLILDDSSNSHQPQRLAALGTVYDIVAVRPKSERTLLMACTALDVVDIISLDMTVRFPCVLRHRTIGAAVGKGIKFEIAYAGGKDPSLSLAAGNSSKEKKIKLTSASAEAVNHLEDGSGLSGMANPESRRQLISNAAHLLRSSRGRGLLIVSEAYSPVVVRGPYDVINMASIWGVDHMRARHALERVPEAVIKAGYLRRSSYKQVIAASVPPSA